MAKKELRKNGNETNSSVKNSTKRIVIFADGTGNSASSPAKTNVWRIYKALDISPDSNQVAIYDGGVGTSSFTPFAVLGLAFGWGLAKNVRQLYKAVCYAYEHDEAKENRSKIYGFGFSRGAFTIRVLAGMIADQGIIDKEDFPRERDLDRQILAAYRNFRKENFSPSLLSFFGRPLRDFFGAALNKMGSGSAYDRTQNFEYIQRPSCNEKECPRYTEPRDHSIEFLGVWDTVDAYGLPIDEMTLAWDKIIWPLSAKDRNISNRIAHASHALALDEQRESFEPMLWNEALNDNKIETNVKQVWFAGVHANIGGGYADDSLSHISLNWMIEESESYGLQFYQNQKEKLVQAADLNGPIYNNRGGVGIVYRYGPRHVDLLNNSEKKGLWPWLKSWFTDIRKETNEVSIATAKIHHTVFDRIKNSGGAYAPINIPEKYEIVEEDGKKYSTVGEGELGKQYERESGKEAIERRLKQSNIWVDILYGQFWYFMMLFMILTFALYPLIGNWVNTEITNVLSGFGFEFGDIENMIAQVVGSFGKLLRMIPSLVGQIPLPFMDLVGKWAKNFDDYPYVFLMFIGVILLFRWCAGKVGGRAHTNMQLAWSHLSRLKFDTTKLKDVNSNAVKTNAGGVNLSQGPVYKHPGASPLRNWLAHVLDIKKNNKPNTGYLPGTGFGYWIGNPLRYFIEIVSWFLFLGFVFALFSRVVFLVLDVSGSVCSGYEQGDLDKIEIFDPPNPEKSTREIENFNTNDPCFPTNLLMEKDATYYIRIDIDKQWFDASLEANIAGLANSPGSLMGMATIVRRHLFTRWYQPVARIHNTFLDRYPLEDTHEPNPVRKANDNSGDTAPADKCAKISKFDDHLTLCTTITAHRDGQLYFYVNDAILFSPDFLFGFYKNNTGTAKLTVTRLPGSKQ